VKCSSVFLLLIIGPLVTLGQKIPDRQIIEYTGTVRSIEPGGWQFALSKIVLDVAGEIEPFVFNPSYGALIFKQVKVGDQISLKAEVDLAGREKAKSYKGKLRTYWEWLANRDRVVEIKVSNNWISINYPPQKKSVEDNKVFIDKKVVGKYYLDGLVKGLIFGDGTIGYAGWINIFQNSDELDIPNDTVSFIGRKMSLEEGFQYPIDGIKAAYSFNKLNRETGKLKSFLFKQNHACIGLKLETAAGKELKLSFPSDKAIQIKKFLNPDHNAKFYYGKDLNAGKFNLPELHALVQGADTLRVAEFYFYGDADGKHEHTPIEFEGKITGISKSVKGSIESIVVASEFYVELDAMMAQQFGHKLEKGKKITIHGQERVKKIGEIYNKNYRIVSPKSITFDGTTFSAYQP